MDTFLAPLPSHPPLRPQRRWRGVLVLALALAASLAAGTAARADDDPPGRVGRVSMVEGDVRTVNADGAWVVLPRNQPLTTGDRVITDKDGRAVLQVGSSTVRLGAYSDMSITRIDDQVVRLHFNRGQMALRVRSADVLGEIGVETDEGLWVPHHAGYFRFDRPAGGVLAGQAWSGDMLLEATDSSLPVAAGQRAEVWREGAQQTTHYRLVTAPTDKFSDWALVEDRLDDRYAASAAASAPVPAEMTGATDLSRYGKWSTAADYGSVWTPTSVPSGWAPYQDGNWAWVAPWGWTWIDNSPWGFAPFHYGRWAFIGSHWCWVPGNWGPRPIYAPALVGWFGGDGFAFGGLPAVGWVPLGPNEAFYPGYAVSPIYWNLVNGPIGHPPVRRTPGPVNGRPRIVPIGPIAYTNRAVPGAVSIVPASSLTAPPSTLPVAQRSDHRRLVGEASEGRVSALPPPAPPAGRGVLTRTAPVIKVPAAPDAGSPPATPAKPAEPAPAHPAGPAAPARAGNGRPVAPAQVSDLAASQAVVPTVPVAQRAAAPVAPTMPATAGGFVAPAAPAALGAGTQSRGGAGMTGGGPRPSGGQRDPR